MNVPFIDLKSDNKFLNKKLELAIKDVLHSGKFILGEPVRSFEKEFADYCKVRYAVGLNSGTDALFLALLSLGVGPGDEVICPVYTYIATALAISYTGAKPIFVDVDKRTFNIDPRQIEKKISKRTKAIIAVHLYGQPAEMASILKISKKYKIKLIEDAAQAHGALWRNQRGKWQVAGAIGDIGCFSFYPTKNLSACGDAGMVVTNNKNIFARLLMLRDQGRRGRNRYLHYIKGYNSRLDGIQAAVLSVKLKFLNRDNKQRQTKARLYTQRLKDCPDIILPAAESYARGVFHIYALRIIKGKRNNIYKQLRRKKIGVSITYHCPLHLQRAYQDLGYKKGDFPVAERISKEVLCLPMYPHLKQEQLKFVVKNLKNCLIRGAHLKTNKSKRKAFDR